MLEPNSLRGYVERLLLPALSLGALVVGSANNLSSAWLWTLLGLTIFLVIVASASPTIAATKQWVERREDVRVSRSAVVNLRALAARFAELVDTRRNDTLQRIIEEEFRQRQLPPAPFLVPPIDFWSDLAGFFSRNMATPTVSVAALRDRVMEFQFIVGSYNRMCVMPVFSGSSADLEAGLTPHSRRSLNLFQQRVVSFLGEVEDFIKDLERSRPAFEHMPCGFVHPRPF